MFPCSNILLLAWWCFWWCKWNFVIHFGGELDLKKIAKINNLISFTMTINSLIAKILKINNCIAEILKINNLTPDELPESKEFNRNFENGVFIPNLYFHNICTYQWICYIINFPKCFGLLSPDFYALRKHCTIFLLHWEQAVFCHVL